MMLVRQKHGFIKQNAKLGSKLIVNFILATIFALLILTGLSGMVFAQEATADHGFDLEANGTVLTFAHQPEDNKILVGGKFTQIGGKNTGRLARLHPDGTLDDTFKARVNGPVHAILVLPDGKIMIGGEFQSIDHTDINYIALLDQDGNLVFDFDMKVNAPVYALVQQNEKQVLVGGAFTESPGKHSYLTRIYNNGKADDTFKTPAPKEGFNDVVRTIALQPEDGKILAGGDFNFELYTTIFPYQTDHIVRLHSDGEIDSSFKAQVDGPVYTILAHPDRSIYIGGDFSGINKIKRSNTGRLFEDGSLDDSFVKLSASINPFLFSFHFTADTNGPVHNITMQPDGKLLLGGEFTKVSGQTRNHLARLQSLGTQGKGTLLDPGFNPGANSPVYSFYVQPDDKIMVGGLFTQIGGESRSRIARLYPDGSLESVFNMDVEGGFVRSLAVQPDGCILLGGTFKTVNGQEQSYIARAEVDGTLDTAFTPDIGGFFHTGPVVNAIAVQPDGKILVGGIFGKIDGETRYNLARLNRDGTLDLDFIAHLNYELLGEHYAYVHTLAIQPDGKILVGGFFDRIGGSLPKYLARLNSDGTVDHAFNPDVGGTVRTISVQADGKIMIGGFFNQVSEMERNQVARLNPDGTLDTTFNATPEVAEGYCYISNILIQPDGRYIIGGNFTGIDGTSKRKIARLHHDGQLDTGYYINNLIRYEENPSSMAKVGMSGNVIVGGDLGHIGHSGMDYTHLFMMNIMGGIDTRYAPYPDKKVEALAIQPDGKVLAGGHFTEIAGESHPGLARLSATRAASSKIEVADDGTSVQWLRSGGGPGLDRVTFELGLKTGKNLTRWELIEHDVFWSEGAWKAEGLELPLEDTAYIRARGYYDTGRNNGSSSIHEASQLFFLYEVDDPDPDDPDPDDPDPDDPDPDDPDPDDPDPDDPDPDDPEPSFSDVPLTHPFYDEIEALVAAGITGGYDDGTFRPSNTVTRMAMAAFLVRALDLEDQYEVPAEPSFTDVSTGHPFYSEIELLAASGITGGYDDGTFRPSNTVTRMATAAFLVRGFDLGDQYEVPAEASFTDVSTGHPFYSEIELLAASGITGGYDDGTFRPSNSVTRMAMAAFLVRGLGLDQNGSD